MKTHIQSGNLLLVALTLAALDVVHSVSRAATDALPQEVVQAGKKTAAASTDDRLGEMITTPPGLSRWVTMVMRDLADPKNFPNTL
jgi:hypothetical protein